MIFIRLFPEEKIIEYVMAEKGKENLLV